INPKTQMPPCPLQVYYKLHYNVKKQSWKNDHSRIEYVIALKKELEHSNDMYQRISEFISTKFPEFEKIISTLVADEANDLEGLS
ncbi:hypothetical protein R6Q59_023431, partial [Mikania micrantha]